MFPVATTTMSIPTIITIMTMTTIIMTTVIPTLVRSPRHRISYSGDRDPMLVELSDVLPPEFYM